MTNEHGDLSEAPQTAGTIVPPSEEPVAGAPPRDEAQLSMDELMAQYDAAEPLQELREGEVVLGTVVQIDEQGAMIDVGTKSEGIIPRPELDLIRNEIHVGDQIEVCVLRIEDEDGHLRVSKRQADRERAWGDIIRKQESGEELEAPVVEAVKGGLLVDLGVYGQGFVPASHVSIGRPRNLQRYVGQTLRLRVIEVERRRKRVVLSHRIVLEEARAATRDQTVGSLREGQVRRGTVRRITDFGAFVDLGGLDGLLHISEMSWTHLDSPREQLKVNDPVDVMVLKLNLEEGRISLGRRQLLHDPWRDVPKLYREGQAVRATVVKVKQDRALVRLPVGIEGVIELPEELRPSAATEAEAAAEATEPTEATEASEPIAAAAAGQPEASPEGPPPRGLAPGDEVEVRVEAIHLAERDLELVLASTPRAPRSRPQPAAETAVPLVRGRYSDRREEEEDDSGRSTRRDRRDRRREREREREREEPKPAAVELPPAAASQRTLGDLMGDTLRRLMAETTQESEPREDKPAADPNPAEDASTTPAN